jgi:ubiquinone/menaquinone biosynthesis C-methylase UbiE
VWGGLRLLQPTNNAQAQHTWLATGKKEVSMSSLPIHEDKEEEKTNAYINDPESGAEMARLLDQDRMLTSAMGGLAPEIGSDLAEMQDVLDLACGPGGWALELAFTHPTLSVTGVDISHAMIDYAQAQARVQRLDNATFVVSDVTKPLTALATDSFDLINARTMAGFMKKESWPRVVGECVRLLRPGGVLRVTEVDRWGTSPAPAFSRLMDLVYEATWFSGHSFDSSRGSFGVTPLLERLQTEEDLEIIGQRAYAVNFSNGQPAYRAMCDNFRVFFQMVMPFLKKVRSTFGQETTIPPKEELDRLYNEMIVEMLQADFAGLFYLLTVVGRKP